MKVGDFFTVIIRTDGKDNSFINDCLEIIVLDGQLARVKEHRGKDDYYKWTLNLSEYNTRILSKEFVRDVLNSESSADVKQRKNSSKWETKK